MKQYLSPEQTAKLIELGFEKPYRPDLDLVETYGYSVDAERNYSIGELIEMLPPIIDEYSSCVISGGADGRCTTNAYSQVDTIHPLQSSQMRSTI